MPTNIADRYLLKERLGEGGKGVVYRALDTLTNTYVAIKTFRGPADPNKLQMFKRVGAELAKVLHPSVADVRDVAEVDQDGVRKACLITPLQPGTTLAALIQSASPRLTTDFVINIVVRACEGLQAAHEMDLIHGDLKPSNIFIKDDDTVTIIDFGLVYTMESRSLDASKGSWEYMPPEQLDGTAQLNRSFDIFSLGVVAYEALTLHQPFKRRTFEDTVEAVRHFIPQAISERNLKISPLVGKAVTVAMAKHPSCRYASAREFAETLQKAQQNKDIERFDPARIRPRIERAQKAFKGGDSDFASEILNELAAEGDLDPDMALLRAQIDEANKEKRIYQLLAAAQTRFEQDEILLALEKLEAVLKLDPQNVDACKMRERIEEQVSKQQASKWLQLARKHFDHDDFNEARRALKEVLNVRHDDPDASSLKAQLDTREREVEITRAEIEHLYKLALSDNQNGEISPALSKLEKLIVLSRNVPAASISECAKVFQALHSSLCTARDRIENSYSEGARQLSENDFERALETCREILARYPENEKFQALRLKAQESQRQRLNTYIAAVGSAADAEPNLDRRVSLLEEACKRYPQEGQFSLQLSLAGELRDLATSLVAKARLHEEQGRFVEAIAQWNTLSDLHPPYLGIDLEINRLERCRQQQSEENMRSNLIAQINCAIERSDYGEAERLSVEAVREFPDNSEVAALQRLSQESLRRNREANRLLGEARTIRAHGDVEQAIALLRQAHDVDDQNIIVVNTLVSLLVEHAHTVLDRDVLVAEQLASEAERLDPLRPSVKKVVSLVVQAKGKQALPHRCLEEALADSQNPEQHVLGATAIELEQSSPASALPPLEDFSLVEPPIQSPASPVSAFPPKVPPPSSAPRVLQQIREAGELFVQNVEGRLNIPYRKVVGILWGLLAFFLFLGVSLLFSNRTHPPVMADSQGQKPPVVDLAQNNDPSAKSDSGHEAAISSSDATSNSLLRGQPEKRPTSGGAAIVDDGNTSFAIVGGKQLETPVADAEKASDRSAIGDTRNKGPVGISVTPKTAKLFIDNRPMHPKKPGVWFWTAVSGRYQCKITADGMNDEVFNIALKKGVPFSRRIEMTPKSPPLVPLTILGGTPGATVRVDDSAIGELDDKGNFFYSELAAGTHKIQLSKPGYGSRAYYGQVFVAGRSFDLPGDKQLSVEAGFAKVAVTPTNAVVSYKRSGEAERHPVSDFSTVLILQPGTYEFAADAPNHSASTIPITIQPNQTTSVSLNLQPIKIEESKMELVNMDEAIKQNGKWYHGRTDKFIRLMTNSSTNTIFFSKEFKVKKMSWQVHLGSNTITYKLDAKGVFITRNIDGVASSQKVKDDLSSIDNPSASYAATIKLDKNEVIVARQDGTVVNTSHDDKHDWSQAQIFAKGDTYFALSPSH